MVHETIQGTFRQTNLTNESADYLAKRIILIDDVGAASSAIPGSPPITQITFPACRAHYPGGPNRCLSVSSLSARPSPVNGRVGIHNFTFVAYSSFTRVTACRVARPPKRRTLS